MSRINKILNSPEVMSNEKLHQVVITLPEDVKIIGSLQEGIQISYSPEYSTVGDLIPLPGISTLENFVAKNAGAQLFNGITSQKQYTGASYIDITVNIKTLDTTGNGDPLKYAALLAQQCQPLPVAFTEVVSQVKDKTTDVIELASKLKDTAGNVYKQVTDEPVASAKGAYDSTVNAASGFLDQFVNFDGAAVDAGIEKLSKLYSKKRLVKLDISDYLSFKEMVITNVSQQFSYEQSFSGPLYAEFAITFSTLRVPDAISVLDYYKTTESKSSRINIG